MYLCLRNKVETITELKESMNVYEYLLSYGIKPSVQRIAIMDYLLKHRTHPCIDEIYMALCSEIPTLSKTTVYNTLKLFVEHGAAKMLTIDERNACFDADTTMHAHFQCKVCGKIYDIQLEEITSAIKLLEKEGYAVEEAHRYYKGICPHCAESGNTGN